MAMTKKEKDAFFAEVKKRGNITKGEVFTPGSLVRGVAKVAAKVAGKKAAVKVATPKSAVKAVPARGKSFNTVKNQKETERLTRNPMPKSTPKSGRGSSRPDSEVVKIKVSDNVTARVPAKSNYEFAKDMSRFGKIQKQNAAPLKPTKAEAKASAKALKAVNKKGKK